MENQIEVKGNLTPKTPSLVDLASLLVRRIESELTQQDALSEVELFRRLALLDALKNINSATEKLLAKLRAPLEEQALSRFEALGINNFNIDGRTVYLHREWWAKTAEGHSVEEAIAALKACEETAVFVKESFNTQTLSAYFRERRIGREEILDAIEKECAEAGIAFDRQAFNESSITISLPDRIITHGNIPPLYPTPELATTVDFSEKIGVRSRQGGK